MYCLALSYAGFLIPSSGKRDQLSNNVITIGVILIKDLNYVTNLGIYYLMPVVNSIIHSVNYLIYNKYIYIQLSL